MLNIGFKKMAECTVAGVIGITLPSLIVLNSTNDPAFTAIVLLCIIYTLATGFAIAVTIDYKMITDLKKELEERVPITRGAKGRFVKHE